MEIKRVGVVGCGRLPSERGVGIAQVCAQSGYRTGVRETEWPDLEHGLARIEAILSKDVSKGTLTQLAALNNLHGTPTAADLADCDLIIEAIVENLDAKRGLYQELDALCPAHTSFASNTKNRVPHARVPGEQDTKRTREQGLNTL